jgi:hypothetical protein
MSEIYKKSIDDDYKVVYIDSVKLKAVVVSLSRVGVTFILDLDDVKWLDVGNTI